MDWYHLLYAVPAIFSGSTLLSYLSPVKISARLVPLLTLLTALAVLAMPLSIDIALAIVPAVAVLHRFFGVSLSAHEPVSVTRLFRIAKEAQTEITQFAARAYPRPGEEETGTAKAAGEPGEGNEPAPEPAPIRSHIPAL